MSNNYELFVGRLGQNPDLRYTQKQEPICFLSVAQKTDNPDKPLWRRVIAWGKQAEMAKLYLKKGNEVFVQGRVEVRNFVDKHENERSIEEVKARLIGFSNL